MDTPRTPVPRLLRRVAELVIDAWRFAGADIDNAPARLTARLVLTPVLVLGTLVGLLVTTVALWVPGTFAWHLRRYRRREAVLAAELRAEWSWVPSPGRTYRATTDLVDMARHDDEVVISGIFVFTEVTEDGVGTYKRTFRFELPADQVTTRRELLGFDGEFVADQDGVLHARSLTPRFSA